MKWLAIILSIYIVYLVSTPCADGVSIAAKSHAGQTAHQNHREDKVPTDTCSPFCVCVCCNVTVVVADYFKSTRPITVQRESYIPVYENIISIYNQSIWQPPKIG